MEHSSAFGQVAGVPFTLEGIWVEWSNVNIISDLASRSDREIECKALIRNDVIQCYH